MRILALSGLFMLSTGTTYSQQPPVCDSVYLSVEEMPKYKNGDPALLMKDLSKISIGKDCRDYPPDRINWVVDADGNMTNIEIPGVDGLCRDLIVSQLKHLQYWTAGKHNGKTVCVRQTARVHIRH